MQLYSTRTQEKEQVHLDRQIGIYCCGITPYDTTHLGHAFTFLHVDVLARLLRRLGAKVTYVQNLTDVDDDLLKKARELGTGYKELAFSQTERFLADLHAINISEPDRYVQATDHIPEMVALIRSLLDA
ncbi:MAG: class I tRNA ligase family protein, partial [Anaerolineae bacterium]|nr:class I tRNA ligase family protein [Anaerolineae bacterium]